MNTDLSIFVRKTGNKLDTHEIPKIHFKDFNQDDYTWDLEDYMKIEHILTIVFKERGTHCVGDVISS